jgi:hypothetical protein
MSIGGLVLRVIVKRVSPAFAIARFAIPNTTSSISKSFRLEESSVLLALIARVRKG